ncbi:tetratricopeptide repeat protein [Mucilaginibacter limnophilus]|uniref:Tetratricopeptide repeat protein n=1 Tax=Mucilaginibacter limnophilus TaxID=1932778 RepID=A0A437MW94_9SPHI|nr:tetratricopeptide repeat protein [Mucilaginibacter limnophilus]RVU01897.1 tetratricopeptide repeat protein [Mucilaginibacter limnophilus]
MKFRLFILMLALPAITFAQDKKKAKSGVVMVVGKPMTAMDSIMAKQLFFSALREKTIENFTLAGELFNRVLQINPENDAALFELAALKKSADKENEAQELLQKAVTVNPDNEWYWVALADSYQKTNDIDKLENVYDELIRLNPEKPDYYFDKASAYFLQKRYDEALKLYDRVEELTGLTDDIIANRQKIYLKQNKFEKATADLDVMIASNPGELRYYLLQAELYNSNGFADKALEVLEKAGRLNPDNGLLHLALADIYRDKKDFKSSFNQLVMAFSSAEIDVNQKIRIVLGYLPKFPDADAKASALELSGILANTHPGDAKAQALYGDMLMQNERYNEAKPLFKKAISLAKDNYAAFEQLVRLELSEESTDEAITDGEEALSYFPNQAWMNYLVGAAWAMKKDHKKAVSYLKTAIGLNADDKNLFAYAYSSLGDSYHSLNDIKSSDEAYEKALDYNPDNAFTLNNYAYYLSLRGEQLEKAAEMSKRSNELQPNTASFEDTYAWILFKQKKYAEAKEWMEKALLHDKNNSAVQSEHYGDIMFYLGNTEAAVQNWKKAKANGGGSPILDRKINEKKYVE